MKMKVPSVLVVISIVFVLESNAGQITGLGTAIGKILKSSKGVVRSKLKHKGKTIEVYTTSKKTKARQFAFVQKGLYPPDCTHTWVIGIDANTLKVTGIQPVEMSCHHAYPTYRNKSFYRQYIGKRPKDIKKLKKNINNVVKATGSSELTTDAVEVSLQLAKKHRKEL